MGNRRLCLLASAVAFFAAPVSTLAAQGPAAVGLRSAAHPPVGATHTGDGRAALSHRRGTTAGTGAVIGLVVGGAFGLLAIRTPGPGEGDGLGYGALIGLAVIGAGIGALVGYMVGQQP